MALAEQAAALAVMRMQAINRMVKKAAILADFCILQLRLAALAAVAALSGEGRVSQTTAMAALPAAAKEINIQAMLMSVLTERFPALAAVAELRIVKQTTMIPKERNELVLARLACAASCGGISHERVFDS